MLKTYSSLSRLFTPFLPLQEVDPERKQHRQNRVPVNKSPFHFHVKQPEDTVKIYNTTNIRKRSIRCCFVPGTSYRERKGQPHRYTCC